jgi:hypothetical protein
LREVKDKSIGKSVIGKLESSLKFTINSDIPFGTAKQTLPKLAESLSQAKVLIQ